MEVTWSFSNKCLKNCSKYKSVKLATSRQLLVITIRFWPYARPEVFLLLLKWRFYFIFQSTTKCSTILDQPYQELVTILNWGFIRRLLEWHLCAFPRFSVGSWFFCNNFVKIAWCQWRKLLNLITGAFVLYVFYVKR